MPQTRNRTLVKEGNFKCIFSHQYIQRAFHFIAHETFICGTATTELKSARFLLYPELSKPVYTIQFDNRQDRNDFFNFLKHNN